MEDGSFEERAHLSACGSLDVYEIVRALVECGFLSNAHDLALLKSEAYWEKLAQGMYNGLYNFFSY